MQKSAVGRWFFAQSELVKQPDQGFSVLSVDYSEHAATRFKGGVFGWIEAGGAGSDWSRELARIAFSLKDDGEVSPDLRSYAMTAIWFS